MKKDLVCQLNYDQKIWVREMQVLPWQAPPRSWFQVFLYMKIKNNYILSKSSTIDDQLGSGFLYSWSSQGRRQFVVQKLTGHVYNALTGFSS